MCMLVESVHMRDMSKAATTQRAWILTGFLLRQRDIIKSDTYLKALNMTSGLKQQNIVVSSVYVD